MISPKTLSQRAIVGIVGLSLCAVPVSSQMPDESAPGPRLQITSHSNSVLISTTSDRIEVQGTATSDVPVVSVYWSIDGEQPIRAIGLEAWRTGDILLHYGVTRITVTAVDEFKRLAVGQLFVERTDATAPVAGRRIQRGWYRDRWVTFQIRNNVAIVEGDIIISLAEVQPEPPVSSARLSAPRPLSVIDSNSSHRWPNGTIPFVLDSAFTSSEQAVVTAAMTEWKDKTNSVVHFVARTTEADYVFIRRGTKGSSCNSDIGRRGGQQTINLEPDLGNGTCLLREIVAHEMGHTIGLWHEQSRSDRDHYITINYDNIDCKWYEFLYCNNRAQFDKAGSNGTDYGYYDYYSVMHYDSFAFSKDTINLLTIITIPADILIGQRYEISPQDVVTVRAFYGSPPNTIQINTNPRGLRVIVDGQSCYDPCQKAFAAGTKHTISAPSPQQQEYLKEYFARWNDNSDEQQPLAGQTHDITVDVSKAVITANYAFDLPDPLCSIEVGASTFGAELVAFQDAFSRNGNRPDIGCPINAVHSWFGGHIQDFDGSTTGKGKGALMLFPNKDAYWVHGAIWSYYEQHSGPGLTFWDSSTLGYPTTDETVGDISSASGSQTSFNRFENGEIQFFGTGTRAGQAYVVRGPILQKWNAACSGSKCRTAGPLGMPIDEEQAAPASPAGTTGRFQSFESGRIYLHLSGGHANSTFLVQFAIFQKYLDVGGSSSNLGFPVSDEYPWNGGARSDFEGGYISWAGSTGALVTFTSNATVSTPQKPSGPIVNVVNSTYAYTTSGSVVSSGGSVQYRFLWGDGSESGWLAAGATSASKSWTKAGQYSIEAQARSASNAAAVSAFSPVLSVNVSDPSTNATSLTLTVTASPSGTVAAFSSVVISGTALYNTGVSPSVGTVTIDTGEQIYTAAISNGSFSRVIAAPSSSRNITITARDNLYNLSKSIILFISITGVQNGGSYTFGRSTTSHDVQSSDPFNPITESQHFSRFDGHVYIWLGLTNLFKPVQARFEFYDPAGVLQQTVTTNWSADPAANGFLYYSYWNFWAWLDIANYLPAYTPGRWSSRVYANDGSSGFKYLSTQEFIIGYDFAEHRLAQDVQVTSPFDPINQTNVFYQTDAKALTWGRADDSSDALDVKWDFYEPAGTLFFTTTYHVDGPGSGNYFAWMKFWGWVNIMGTATAQKCGKWHVNVFVKDPSGTYQNLYTDYFQIFENPNQPPLGSLTSTPTSPVAGINVSLTTTVTDNTYLQKAIMHWQDSSSHTQTWDNILASTLNQTVSIGSFAQGQTVEYWVEAWDTSGNRTESAHRTFTAAPTPNPTPIASLAAPTAATVNDATTTITVNGSGFTSDSSVRWNGSTRSTTYVSANTLTAVIPATDLVAPGIAQITVFNGPPGGGTSGPLAFAINNPVPSVGSVNPSTMFVGQPQFVLAVRGTGLIPSSTVRWNGANLVTTFLSSSDATAIVPAANLSSVGSATITVVNPTPGGGISSAATVTVAADPVPVISAVTPASALVGSAPHITVQGSGFVNGSIIQVKGATVPTTFISSSSLQAAMPASTMNTAITVPITVVNAAPGGGTSNSFDFTVLDLVLSLSRPGRPRRSTTEIVTIGVPNQLPVVLASNAPGAQAHLTCEEAARYFNCAVLPADVTLGAEVLATVVLTPVGRVPALTTPDADILRVTATTAQGERSVEMPIRLTFRNRPTLGGADDQALKSAERTTPTEQSQRTQSKFSQASASSDPEEWHVSVVVSRSKVATGDSVTFTAMVKHGADPGQGAVEFACADTIVGKSKLDGSGVARLTTATLRPGECRVNARYAIGQREIVSSYETVTVGTQN